MRDSFVFDGPGSDDRRVRPGAVIPVSRAECRLPAVYRQFLRDNCEIDSPCTKRLNEWTVQSLCRARERNSKVSSQDVHRAVRLDDLDCDGEEDLELWEFASFLESQQYNRAGYLTVGPQYSNYFRMFGGIVEVIYLKPSQTFMLYFREWWDGKADAGSKFFYYYRQ